MFLVLLTVIVVDDGFVLPTSLTVVKLKVPMTFYLSTVSRWGLPHCVKVVVNPGHECDKLI